MEAFKCDICGEFYEPYNYFSNQDHEKPNAIVLCNKSSSGFVNQIARYDMCPECMNALDILVKKRRG